MIPLLGKWRRFIPYLGGIAALLLFAAALVILHKHAQAYRPNEVRKALRTLPAWQPFAALGLVAASYLLLTLYDVLALRHVGRTLPYGRVALASFTAYAFSHALGFASIIGPSIRYRVYTPMGLTAGEVAETSGFVIVTFAIGLVAVFPLIALLDPASLDMLGISQPGGIAIGMLGLVLMAGYIGLGWWMDRTIRLFGYPLHLPRPRTALAQIALSVADLSLVAAVLYACLPHAAAAGYPHVLAVYVLAFVAGLISHVPGGLGVFDAVVLVGLSARLPADQILRTARLSCGVPSGAAGQRGRAVRRRRGAGSPAAICADLGESQYLGRCHRTDGCCRLCFHGRRHAVVLECHAGEQCPSAGGRDGAAAQRDRDIAFAG
jgi:phosphatidylglycerol lysyltransferase